MHGKIENVVSIYIMYMQVLIQKYGEKLLLTNVLFYMEMVWFEVFKILCNFNWHEF